MSVAAPLVAANHSNTGALIPAFCEENKIADVARRTRLQLDHVLVIDDGSPDATAKNAREAGAEVIRHEQNSGKGAAIKTGLRELIARGMEFILILDGDGQHLPEEIPRFIARANVTKAHVIVGSRMDDTRTMPFIRRCTNRVMSWQISRACGQKIPDTQCGYRMIHRDVTPHLFCETNAYDYETEMLLIAAQRGFQISSAAVSTVYGDEKSKIHPVRDTMRFLRLMARYRQNRH